MPQDTVLAPCLFPILVSVIDKNFHHSILITDIDKNFRYSILIADIDKNFRHSILIADIDSNTPHSFVSSFANDTKISMKVASVDDRKNCKQMSTVSCSGQYYCIRGSFGAWENGRHSGLIQESAGAILENSAADGDSGSGDETGKDNTVQIPEVQSSNTTGDGTKGDEDSGNSVDTLFPEAVPFIKSPPAASRNLEDSSGQ